MPRSRFGSWEMPDSPDWLSQGTRDDARDVLAALRLIHRGPRYYRYTDKDGNRVVKRVKNIEFGPVGRAALVGDDQQEEAA